MPKHINIIDRIAELAGWDTARQITEEYRGWISPAALFDRLAELSDKSTATQIINEYRNLVFIKRRAKSKLLIPMHPADINAALLKSGSNQSRIAEQLKISCNAVSNVIHNRMTSRRIATAISKTTGYPIEKLWPGKYTHSQRLAA